ncbi:MAG: hypothetical protein ABIJ00_10850 [Candidatus Eisenbacteria bacterium]
MAMQTVCKVCGRRGRRRCPATGDHICAQCCGSRRGTEFGCPADCEFYPFAVAGYDLWLSLSEALPPKVVRRVRSEVSEFHFRSVLNRFLSTLSGYEEHGGSATYLASNHCVFAERDGQGKTLADRWETDGWAGLRPDEAVMMEYQSRSFVTVTEIQRVVDHERVECIDVFDARKTPFTLVDRATAAHATRFSRFLGWLTHYPHFSKLGQVSLEVPQMVYREFLDRILEYAHEEGYADDERGLKACMTEHLADLMRLLVDMPREKMKSVFKSIDAYHCVGTYDIAGHRKAIKRILEAKPDFERDDRDPDEGDPPGVEYYDWLRLGESQAIESEMDPAFRHAPGSELVGGVGRIRLYEDRLVVEAFTRKLFDFGKAMILHYFGRQAKLLDDEISEIAGNIADSYEDEDNVEELEPGGPSAEQIPPEVQAEMMKKFYEERYTRFLDEPVPALDGMTPREASRRPEARPMLIELMKDHLSGIESMNRDEGADISIDFALKELGLEELLG